MKIKNENKKILTITIIATLIFVAIFRENVFASSIESSIPFFANLKGAIEDITKYLRWALISIGVGFLIYFSIKLTSAEAHTKEQVIARIKTVIIAIIVGVSATYIVNYIVGLAGGTTV